MFSEVVYPGLAIQCRRDILVPQAKISQEIDCTPKEISYVSHLSFGNYRLSPVSFDDAINAGIVRGQAAVRKF